VAVTYGAQGTAGNGTNNASLTYPTGISASTSELFAIVCGRCSVADTAWAAPTGWTSVGQFEGGTGTFGVDTGTRRVAFFRKDTVDGTETGTVNFAFGAGNNQSITTGAIFRVVKTAGYTVAAQFASGADTTNGTAFSATSSTSLDWTTGDLLLIGVAQNIDSGTRSAISVSATDVTFGARVAQIDIAVTTGNDVRRVLDTVPVSAASTTAAATYAHTISAAGSGAVAFLVLTETAVDTDVALIGSEITSGHGTLSVPRSSGQAIELSQGSVAAVFAEAALSGQAVTAEQGLTTANTDGNVALLGSEVAIAQQTIAPTLSKEATGEAATSGHGTASVDSAPTQINFSTLTTSAGTLVAVGGGDVTVHITGEEFAATAGVVVYGGQAITGSATTSAAGTAAPDLSVILSGEGATLAVGTITPEQFADDTRIDSASGTAAPDFSVLLTGEAVTCAQESVEVTGDDSAALSGEASTASAGTAPPVVSVQLTGAQFAGEQYNVGAPGGAALTGASATFSAGEVFTVNDREFALTGASMTAQDGSMFASPLAFVAGQELTVGQADIGPINVALTGEAITSDTGRMIGEGPYTQNPAGGHGKKKPKPPRSTVVIDGEEFTVSSPEEATYLLEKAREQAQELANTAVERAGKAEKRPTRKVLADARKTLKAPEIEASEELAAEADKIAREIEDIYKQAMIAVEIAARLRKEQDDEDDAIINLLL
jgi:hypothetical protein